MPKDLSNRKEQKKEENLVDAIEAVVQKKPQSVWDFVSENEKPLSVLGVIIALLGLVQGTENKRIAAAISVALIIASVALAKSILDKEKTSVKTMGCKIFVSSLEVSYMASIIYWGKASIIELMRMLPIICGMFVVATLREVAGVAIERNGITSKTSLILFFDVVMYAGVISLLLYTVSELANWK